MITRRNKIIFLINLIVVFVSIIISLLYYLFIKGIEVNELIFLNISSLIGSLIFIFIFNKLERYISVIVIGTTFVITGLWLLLTVICLLKHEIINSSFIGCLYLFPNSFYRLFFDPEFGK